MDTALCSDKKVAGGAVAPKIAAILLLPSGPFRIQLPSIGWCQALLWRPLIQEKSFFWIWMLINLVSENSLYDDIQHLLSPIYYYIIITSQCKYTDTQTCLSCGCTRWASRILSRSTLFCTRHSQPCTLVNLLPALPDCSSCSSPYGSQGHALNDSVVKHLLGVCLSHCPHNMFFLKQP